MILKLITELNNDKLLIHLVSQKILQQVYHDNLYDTSFFIKIVFKLIYKKIINFIK
jgi:hypothetical protein